MITVGIRELKEQTSKLLRKVREERETIEITYHGRIIARLVPVESSPPPPEELSAILVDLDQLAAEIGSAWPEGVSAVEAVNEVRREL